MNLLLYIWVLAWALLLPPYLYNKYNHYIPHNIAISVALRDYKAALLHFTELTVVIFLCASLGKFTFLLFLEILNLAP